MSLCESCYFSEGVIQVAKIVFSLERVWWSNRYDGFSYKWKKYIDRLDNGKIWYRKPWMLDFTCPKFEIFGQVGCRTCDMAHINYCLDACKCIEIFRNNLHPRVYNRWESKWLKFCIIIIIIIIIIIVNDLFQFGL